MMPTEIVTSVQEGIKIIIVLVDNHGFASIGGLSRSLGQGGFGTSYRVRSKESGQLDGECLTVDYVANARSLGAHAIKAGNLAELKEALEKAKTLGPYTVIVVETDPPWECRATNPGGMWRWPKSRKWRASGRRGPDTKRRANANAIISEAKGRTTMIETLPNFIDGSWRTSDAAATLNVLNPASAQPLAQVPLSPAEEVHQAAETAARAFPAGGEHPPESASSRYSS